MVVGVFGSGCSTVSPFLYTEGFYHLTCTRSLLQYTMVEDTRLGHCFALEASCGTRASTLKHPGEPEDVSLEQALHVWSLGGMGEKLTKKADNDFQPGRFVEGGRRAGVGMWISSRQEGSCLGCAVGKGHGS